MREGNIITIEGYEAFYTPMEFLIKADSKDPNVIYIEASNEEVDYDKEVLFMKALEDEAESFLKKGIISWDHLHKSEKSPEYIIGEPLDVKFDSRAKKTLCKAKLYKQVQYAKDVLNLLASGCTRLGASVGGFIKQKSPLAKSLTGILKVIWDELAITYKPKNDSTLGNVTLIPMEEFAKALAVGSGVDASSFSGGRALTPESMQGSAVNLTPNNINKMMNELVWRIKSKDINTTDDIRDFLKLHEAESLYNNLTKLLVKKFNSKKMEV